MKEIRIEATATVENQEVRYAEVPDDFDINDAFGPYTKED